MFGRRSLSTTSTTSSITPIIEGLDPLKVYILRQGNTLYSYLPITKKNTDLR